MLIGFGCSVPAIMATRTLASERDRKMTMILTPFMSCSAKLPIYGVFISAFFYRFAFNSSTLRVAVPIFCTTIPAATFAMRMASVIS